MDGEIYERLRVFADSWGLLWLALAFVVFVAWVMRPGARAHYAEQAEIPFRHDEGEVHERRADD